LAALPLPEAVAGAKVPALLENPERVGMKIQNDCYVEIDYRLTSDTGEVLDESEPDHPLAFIFGRGQMIPGLEMKMEGMGEGEEAKITVEAEDGYGLVREELFREMPKDSFPEDLELTPGMHLRASGPHGPLTLTVKSVQEDTVTIDLNHPLAGQRLHFDVKVVESREATDEEILAMSASCSPDACAGCGGSCH
jgi:FKBP-type peptidyl-prolyl cis-trans isomerase SlyD